MSRWHAGLLLPVLLMPLMPGAAGRAADAPRRRFDALDARQRLEYLRRAMVWRPTRVSEMDLLAGPKGDDAFPFDGHVDCVYATPERLSGATPKFLCDVGANDVVKVKYGRGNGEVYAEVAATRLFWALGFGADRMYPVSVTCRHCPIEPWWWHQERRVEEKSYDIASIERRLDARKMETRGDEGWAWRELDLVDEQAGGAPRAHRDALKLLMVFVQNSDTKASNQRLACLTEGVREDAQGNQTCEAPFLYVSDLGLAFGKATLLGTSKARLDHWEREPIWRDPEGCVGNLRKSLPGTLKHPRISEAGRGFLASLLAQLSDGQIADLFKAARLERHPHQRPVDDWVRVFKDKRAQIASRRCPD